MAFCVLLWWERACVALSFLFCLIVGECVDVVFLLLLFPFFVSFCGGRVHGWLCLFSVLFLFLGGVVFFCVS